MTPARRVSAATAVLLLLAAACVKSPPSRAFSEGEVDLACCGHADERVDIVYLGVGGWLLRKGDQAVLTAPLFSNPTFWRAGFAPIEPDTARIRAHLPDVADVTAILVGHGHYDHLMDVPYVALHHAPRATVYLNETARHQIAPMGVPDARLHVIGPDELGDAEREGRWIQAGDGVRIMPLRSDHAPHFAGETLYSGVREREMERAPRAATEWLDGETVAYLIDLLNADGSVGLRVYFQDAVAAPPLGLVPPLSDGVAVDVVLLVPATYAEVRWHPEALLESAEPEVVLLGHWEDFFEPPDEPARPVPFTDLPDFLERLDRATREGAEWHLPMPFTRFRFH